VLRHLLLLALLKNIPPLCLILLLLALSAASLAFACFAQEYSTTVLDCGGAADGATAELHFEWNFGWKKATGSTKSISVAFFRSTGLITG